MFQHLSSLSPLAFRFTLLRGCSKVGIKRGCLTSETKVESESILVVKVLTFVTCSQDQGKHHPPHQQHLPQGVWKIMECEQNHGCKCWVLHLILHGYLRWLHGLIRNFLFLCISCLKYIHGFSKYVGDVLLIISAGFCKLCTIRITIMLYLNLEPVETSLIFCEEFQHLKSEYWHVKLGSRPCLCHLLTVLWILFEDWLGAKYGQGNVVVYFVLCSSIISNRWID